MTLFCVVSNVIDSKFVSCSFKWWQMATFCGCHIRFTYFDNFINALEFALFYAYKWQSKVAFSISCYFCLLIYWGEKYQIRKNGKNDGLSKNIFEVKLKFSTLLGDGSLGRIFSPAKGCFVLLISITLWIDDEFPGFDIIALRFLGLRPVNCEGKNMKWNDFSCNCLPSNIYITGVSLK